MADTRYEIIVQTKKLESDAVDTNVCKYFTKWVQFVNSSTVNGSTVGALNAEFRISFNVATLGRYLGVKSSAPGFALVGAFYPVPGETYTFQYSFTVPNTRAIDLWFGQGDDTGAPTATIAAGSTEGILTFTWGASTTGQWYLETGAGSNMTTIMTVKLGNIYCPGPLDSPFVPAGDLILKYLDTYKYEPVDLTYNIADIQDISKRNSSFSRTITLPETKNNRQVFANISNLASDASFDPNLKARAWILVDTVVVFEGNLQLKNIKLNDNLESQYEVVIYADNDTFFSRLGEKYIEDLDFTELNHTWDRDNIYNSWFSDWRNGYFYPLIDYGQGWIYEDISSGTDYDKQLNIQEFLPATYVKTIWNKIFLEAGYEWESTFLNTPEFENLLIPFNGKNLTNAEDFAEDKLFAVGLTASITTNTNIANFDWINTVPPAAIRNYFQVTNATIYNSDFDWKEGGAWQNLNFANESSPYGDSNGLWDSTNYYFNNYYTGFVQQFKFFFDVDFIRELQVGGPFNGQALPTFETTMTIIAFREFNPDGTTNAEWASGWGYPCTNLANNDNILIEIKDYFGGGPTLASNTPTFTFSPNVDGTLIENNSFHTRVSMVYTMPAFNDVTFTTGLSPLYPGERLRFKVLYTSGADKLDRVVMRVGAVENGADGSVLYPGGIINYSVNVPKKVKQVDFITSLVKMFNLYIEPSKERANTLIVEPRDIYYATGDVKDWTSKIDLNIAISEQILADTQNRETLFTYKDDKDYLNQNYKDQFQEIYGQYLYTSENEFTKSRQTIQPIFGPTPISSIPNTNNSIIIPRIIKDNSSINALYMSPVDHIIRIVQRGDFPQFFEDGNYNFDFTIIADASLGQDYIDITATSGEVTDYLSVGNIVEIPDTNSDRYEITSVTNLGGTNRRVFIFPTLSGAVSSSSILKVKVPVNSGLISISQSGKKLVFDGLDLTSGLDFVYPYVGHYNNPYVPTNDINFGQLREDMYSTDYTTANNLVNTYWLQFLEETTGRDSRIITVQMYLTPVDIQNFRFNDSIYLFFNGNGHYYRVNKISGYDPGQIKTCTVELIRAQQRPVVKQLKRTFSKLESITDGLATNVLLPNGWNSLGPAGGGGGNSPGDIISNGYVGTGIRNTVKGGNELVNGNYNNVLGDKIILSGDKNKIERRSQSVLINGDSNFNSNPGRSTFINGASNSVFRENIDISINGDLNTLLIEPFLTICGTATVCEDTCTLRTSGINYTDPTQRKIYLSDAAGPWLDPCETYNDIANGLYFINVYDCDDNLLDVVQIGIDSSVTCSPTPSSGTFRYYNEDENLLTDACYFTYCDIGTTIYDQGQTLQDAFPGGTTVSIPDNYDPSNLGDLIGKTLTIVSTDFALIPLVNFVTIDGVTNNLNGTYTIQFTPALSFTFSEPADYNINLFTDPESLGRYWCLQGDFTAYDGSSIELIQAGVTYSGSMQLSGFTNSITSVSILDPETGEPYEVPGELGASSSFCIRYFTGINTNKDILINGDNNFIHGSSSNLNIFGNNNDLGFATKNISVHGNNNIIENGLEDVFIIGNNITVTQSSTNVIGNDFSFEGDLEIAPGRYIYSGEIGSNSIGLDIGGRLLIDGDSVVISGGSIELTTLLTGDSVNIQGLKSYGVSVTTFPPAVTSYILIILATSTVRPRSFKLFYKIFDQTAGLTMTKEDVVQMSYDGTDWVVEDQFNIFELQTNPGTPITSTVIPFGIGNIINFEATNNEANNIYIKLSVQEL
jgi:hypothetical protein